ncbi:hypothetical protein KC19_VG092600 [Ceratodon purpureus]|uniref:Uncharacterized protein n=1 Tax=Ceratodon purpureus TaxID=3225 RepID=A0A8T0HNN2_CERPU|nr:hypothetical protein KC19_VG092600 [Ceratodon purpureus]
MDSGRSSSAEDVHASFGEADMVDEPFEEQPLEAMEEGVKKPVTRTPPRLNQVESDVAELKSNVSEILQRLIVYEGFPRVMEELLQTIKNTGDRTAHAHFSAACDGSQVNVISVVLRKTVRGNEDLKRLVPKKT